MKLILDRKKILESLAKVTSLVEKRNILPILDMVKITIKDQIATLTTTDLDLTCQDSFQLEDFNDELEFLLPVHPFFEIIKKLTNYNKVELDLEKLDSGKVEIVAGASEVTIPALTTEEFPSFEPLEEEIILIKVIDLKELLGKTKHAISGGEMRYYLNGINFSTDESHLIAAATDVHRMAIVKRDKPDGLVIEEGLLIPKKAINEILKLIETLPDKDFVPFQFNENSISVKINNTVLTSKLLNGKFPNYQAIFNLETKVKIFIPLEEFVKALELVSTISDNKIKIVSIVLINNLLTVSLENTKEGRGAKAKQEMIVELEDLRGQETEVKIALFLNSKYLLELLAVASGPRISLSFARLGGPVLVKDEGDDLATFILMPLQLETY
jgi:DNA polymerase-3 subunit beta